MATSPSSSAAKVVTASCPAGKKVLGTGAEVSNGSGQVVIDGVAPNADSSAVTANAFEDETGTALAWTLTAYAICADPLPDALRDSLTFPKGNDTGLFTSNPCPTGMGLLGTGGEIDAGGGQVAMTSLVSLEPNFAVLAGAVDQTGYGTAWGTTVTGICALHAHRKVSGPTQVNSTSKQLSGFCNQGENLTGVGGDIDGARGEAWFNGFKATNPTQMDATAADRSSRSWSARAYALCASALPGYQVVAAGGVGRPGATSRTASPACPAGKKLIGVAAGQTGLGDDGMIQALTPVEGLQSARATFSEVEAADDPAWSMTGQALCADPPPGLELVTAVSETDSDDIKSLTATCPAGKYLLGPGASVAPANGQVVIEDLRPDGTLTSVSVLGIEDATGTEEDWTLRAYAVCADR